MEKETTTMESAAITGTIDFTPLDPPSVSDLTDRVHLLPCSIKLDGPSEISQYFKPRDTDVVADGLSVKEAFFRGRKLLGATVPIPEGYRGYVLDKKKLNKGKGAEIWEGDFGQWESRAEFGNITYWNHDSLPSADDPLLRCFHWFSVADADGNNWTFKPQALEIMWGGDRRYWDVPEDATKPAELKQVSWLEVTGKLKLFNNLNVGKNYKVIFKLRLKTDAFGWNYGPIYFAARPGQTAQYIWRAADLSTRPTEEYFNIEVPFTAPTNPTDKDELLFGIYEIWNGRWKGGLVINEVSIELMK